MEIEGEEYCGEIGTPFTIITNTNNVNLIFQSGGGDQHTGFLAIWSPFDIPKCNSFDNCVTSPNYPNNYPNDVDQVK